MISAILTIFTFVSVIFFPWPLAALLALAASVTEPLVPLAAGLFADTLYYSSSVSSFPFFTLGGAIVTALSFFVRSRLRTGPVRDF